MAMQASIRDPASEKIHLDKRIPVALIITILLQTLAAVWWASGISARQDEATRDRARIQSEVDALKSARDEDRRAAAELKNVVVRIDEKLANQNEKIDRVLRLLDDRPGGNGR